MTSEMRVISNSSINSRSTPYRNETVARHELSYPRGAEIGRFLLGSTVIVCFEKNRARLLDGIHPGTRIRMGEAIARFEPGPQA